MENYKNKVTKGKVTVSNYNERSECFELIVNDSVGNMIAKTTFSDKYKAEAEANATLITESFNVLHDSGYTPSELLVKVEGLVLALSTINGMCADYSNKEDGSINVGMMAKISIDALRQAITNATKQIKI